MLLPVNLSKLEKHQFQSLNSYVSISDDTLGINVVYVTFKAVEGHALPHTDIPSHFLEALQSTSRSHYCSNEDKKCSRASARNADGIRDRAAVSFGIKVCVDWSFLTVTWWAERALAHLRCNLLPRYGCKCVCVCVCEHTREGSTQLYHYLWD